MIQQVIRIVIAIAFGKLIVNNFQVLQQDHPLTPEELKKGFFQNPKQKPLLSSSSIQKQKYQQKKFRDMFVIISDMLQEFRTNRCPTIIGVNDDLYPSEMLNIRDVHICKNILQWAVAENECIIYNFGVGKDGDPFLETFGNSQEEEFYQKCKIYAFDPFVKASELPTFRNKNIHFYPIGLWNGYSPRKVGAASDSDGIGGTLMSLKEIQSMLNHTFNNGNKDNNINDVEEIIDITMFRSDCEGCEYGWIKDAIDDNPSIFQHIQQMFIEIHLVPVTGMPALTLPWSKETGEPPPLLLEAIYNMLTQHYKVLTSTVNHGYPSDRNRVPIVLQQAGVMGYPCCREFNLINSNFYLQEEKKLQSTTDKNRKIVLSMMQTNSASHEQEPTGQLNSDANNYCKENSVIQTLGIQNNGHIAPRKEYIIQHSQEQEQLHHQPIIENMSIPFSNLFLGRRKLCPNGEKDTIYFNKTGDAFCNSKLLKAKKRKRCLIYYFGDFSNKNDIDFLYFLATKYNTCSIHAFDPRFSEDLLLRNSYATVLSTTKSRSISSLKNIIFKPWGIYSGYGPRVIKSYHYYGSEYEEINDEEESQPIEVIGQLYTLSEILLSWTKEDTDDEKIYIPNPKPELISLLRVDWSMVAQCIWEKEILKSSHSWWGWYFGAESIRQAT